MHNLGENKVDGSMKDLKEPRNQRYYQLEVDDSNTQNNQSIDKD